MFGLETREQQKDIDQKIEELDITITAMQKESEAHLKELGLSLEDIEEYIDNPNNFTTEKWEILQYNLKRLEDKLQRDLQNIHNPQKTEETYKTRNAAPHWLPVP